MSVQLCQVQAVAKLQRLCRIPREEEVLEPLIPFILACLDHRHSCVRR